MITAQKNHSAKLNFIESIRGISMLGVIGIHVGSQYLSNPTPNIQLVALFEIVTRFSVPIFFFLSAFCLFYQKNFAQDILTWTGYKKFLLRRMKSLAIPYVAWSIVYFIHYTLRYHDPYFCTIPTFIEGLFFGLASYQLYFVVILLWFYLTMPLWSLLLKKMTAQKLFFCLVIQIFFDYISSYELGAFTNKFIAYRLNYWVIHYFFIFLLGGYLAKNFDDFKKNFLHSKKLAIFFAVSLIFFLAHYEFLIFSKNYSAVSAINTVHQLSPLGVVYTMAACLFFVQIFLLREIKIFPFFGKHSYFIYMAHPFVITYLVVLFEKFGIIMTAQHAIIFYALTVIITLAWSIIFSFIGKKIPWLNVLFLGKK